MQDFMAISLNGWRMAWKGWRLETGRPTGGHLGSKQCGKRSDFRSVQRWMCWVLADGVG